MEKSVMDEYIKSFMDDKKYSQDRDTMKKLFTGKQSYAFIEQTCYEDINALEDTFRNSVLSINNPNGKDAAIRVYKHFYNYLKEKGIPAKVEFPPSSSFERYMYIAKVLHDSDLKVDDLPNKIWVSKRTIEDEIKKLRGLDNDPIEFFNKVFTIPEIDRNRGKINMASTVHPLFLTLNLTQVIATLKGLKVMSENPMYANYAEKAAIDIWEQMSDYAKKQIRYVLSEKLHENLNWYDNLGKQSNKMFSSERDCSEDSNVLMACIKNNKPFCMEVQEGDTIQEYLNCRFISDIDENNNFTVMSNRGEKRLSVDNVFRSWFMEDKPQVKNKLEAGLH